jgi:hypothetical protein
MSAAGVDQVRVHLRCMRQRCSVLARGSPQSCLIEREQKILPNGYLSTHIPSAHCVRIVAQPNPGQYLELALERLHGVGMGVIVDMVSRIDREEGVTCRDAQVNVVRRLQMVCIGSPGGPPALFEHTPRRVVHHLLRRAPRSRILSH